MDTLTFFLTVTLVTLLFPYEIQGYKSKTCTYNGQILYPGYTQIMPCVSCRCNGDTGDVTCSFADCPEQDDPTCTKYETPTGKCCPVCVEHGCFYDNKGYPKGSRIPLGPCKYCYCPWDGAQDGKPYCLEMTCSNVTCSGAFIPPGRCCHICPDGVEAGMHIGEFLSFG